MQRRKFSREYKLEAVKLVRQRGISISQAARELDVHENVLRKWSFHPPVALGTMWWVPPLFLALDIG
jgi:hypothetical protein